MSGGEPAFLQPIPTLATTKMAPKANPLDGHEGVCIQLLDGSKQLSISGEQQPRNQDVAPPLTSRN